jgi:hypothetical protein
MSDDLNLAYALLVASIEALSQEFDGFVPTWADLANVKRSGIGKNAIEFIDDCRLRFAVIASEAVCPFIERSFRPSDFG